MCSTLVPPLSDVLRSDESVILRENSFQLLFVVRPPCFIELVGHHFNNYDLILMIGISLVFSINLRPVRGYTP